MKTLNKTHQLQEELHYICDTCYYQFAYCHPTEAQKLSEQVKEIKSLYDKKVLGEEAYHDLLKLVISIYIGAELSMAVNHKLNSALKDKLSPHRFLKALA